MKEKFWNLIHTVTAYFFIVFAAILMTFPIARFFLPNDSSLEAFILGVFFTYDISLLNFPLNLFGIGLFDLGFFHILAVVAVYFVITLLIEVVIRIIVKDKTVRIMFRVMAVMFVLFLPILKTAF